MSASPGASAMQSTKRPLDEDPSPSGPTDQPEAKRPALDKDAKEETSKVEPAGAAESVATDTKIDADAKPLSNGHAEATGDTAVPDAPNGPDATAAALETQPIQSTAAQQDRTGSQSAASHQAHQDESGWIHIRAVISSAEAATVIGKGGENVSQIRRLSGAKCTVSDYSRGAVERILTVSGMVDAAAKVRYSSQIFASLS
jgi:heterogeneous nuclear rnp K-like protein 2